MSLLSFANQTTVVPNIFTVPVSFNPLVSSVSALQFDFPIPAGVRFDSVVVGPAGTAAQKSAPFNILAGNILRVLLFSPANQTLIKAGIVVNINLVATAAGSSALHLQNAVASDPNGATVPLSTVDGTLAIAAENPTVATTIQQLQADLATATQALTDANASQTAAAKAVSDASTEVNLLIPLANPDVTTEDQTAVALASGLATLKSGFDAITAGANAIVAAIKPITGQ